jgi:hypothetical protein
MEYTTFVQATIEHTHLGTACTLVNWTRPCNFPVSKWNKSVRPLFCFFKLPGQTISTRNRVIADLGPTSSTGRSHFGHCNDDENGQNGCEHVVCCGFELLLCLCCVLCCFVWVTFHKIRRALGHQVRRF